jgi:hypothetical protein
MTPGSSVANPLQVETAPKPALPADVAESRANFVLADHLRKMEADKRQAESDAKSMRRMDLGALSAEELDALRNACGTELDARKESTHAA